MANIDLAERHTLPGAPCPQTDVPLFDLRECLGEQPIAEMPVDFVGPVLELVSGDLAQKFAALLSVLQFVD